MENYTKLQAVVVTKLEEMYTGVMQYKHLCRHNEDLL